MELHGRSLTESSQGEGRAGVERGTLRPYKDQINGLPECARDYAVKRRLEVRSSSPERGIQTSDGRRENREDFA